MSPSQVTKPKKRAAPFSLRLTDEERTKIEEASGGMPVASYIKSVVLADDAPTYRKRKAMPEDDKRLLAEILARLGASRSANNLNQIAKHLNLGKLVVDDQLAEDLNMAIIDVAWIRTTLMEALGVKRP